MQRKFLQRVKANTVDHIVPHKGDPAVFCAVPKKKEPPFGIADDKVRPAVAVDIRKGRCRIIADPYPGHINPLPIRSCRRSDISENKDPAGVR